MKFDVVTIGSAVLDVLMKSSAFRILPVQDQLMVCEMYGGKMDVDEAVIASGGAATNTAASFARQGFLVGCIAELGVDVSAQLIWDELHREGVHTRLLVQEKAEHTGISSVLVASDGSRSAMTYRGSSHELHVEDIDWQSLTSVRAIHLSNVGDLHLIRKVHAHCREHRIFLSWNPGKQEAQDFFLKEFTDQPHACNVLFLNDQEWDSVKQNEAGVKRCADMVVITRGKQGGEVIVDGVTTQYEAKIVPVVDETGAGDAFASGFVGAHLRGMSLREALNFGVENASGVVGYMGAKKGLLYV